jgi:hypothetical protein
MMTLADSRPRRLLLAAVYLLFGGITAVGELRPRGAPVSSPALVFSWTLLVGFAPLAGWVVPTLPSALAYAGGVWTGAVVWLAVLFHLVPRFLSRSILRGVSALTAMGLGLLGILLSST